MTILSTGVKYLKWKFLSAHSIFTDIYIVLWQSITGYFGVSDQVDTRWNFSGENNGAGGFVSHSLYSLFSCKYPALWIHFRWIGDLLFWPIWLIVFYPGFAEGLLSLIEKSDPQYGHCATSLIGSHLIETDK